MSRKRIGSHSTGGPRLAAPETAQLEDCNQKRPIFSLQYMQAGWCVVDCDREQKGAFADKLHELSQLNWVDIIMTHRRGNGLERLPCGCIRQRVPDSVAEEVSELIAIRFWKKRRMVGYRDRDVFHILWLDLSGKLYDHGR